MAESSEEQLRLLPLEQVQRHCSMPPAHHAPPLLLPFFIVGVAALVVVAVIVVAVGGGASDRKQHRGDAATCYGGCSFIQFVNKSVSAGKTKSR